MRYLSTRGDRGRPGFAAILIDGLAPDGGLFMPESWPRIDVVKAGPYPDVVARTFAPFVSPDPLEGELEAICFEAYSGFRHPEVAPLRPLADGRHLLELYWGPTLAFKDYALQVVGRLFDRVLSRHSRKALVLGATSGDTGSAAIEACRGRDHIDVVILFPRGRVSDFQRRQMTTVPDSNVTAVAVAGTFDDCQALVKRAFADTSHGLPLAAVNSINLARIIAQSAYYAWAAAHSGWAETDFAVPTGNFGNVFSGWTARRMGLPVGQLIIANNANRGVTELVSIGTMAVEPVIPTIAPAMDIQIPSNLERYLYELAGGDTKLVGAWQDEIGRTGRLRLRADETRQIRRDFGAGWLDDDRAIEVIRRVFETEGILLDPHTALGWEVGSQQRRSGVGQVVIGTAHPVKFGEAVRQATGIDPELPPGIEDLSTRPERMIELPNDYEALRSLLRGEAFRENWEGPIRSPVK